MGKIVFSSISPETVERINTFAHGRGIPTSVFEEMSDGIDHAEVGARLAERWNFPEVLVATIRYHHSPLKAPASVRDVVAVVYLANELANLSDSHYEQLDIRVLRIVGVQDRTQLQAIHERLSDQYDREFSRLERQR